MTLASTITALAAAAALLGGGAAAYLSPHLVKLLQVRRLRALCRRRGVLALTFDDGPGTYLTPRVLDVLARAGGRATFFPLGHQASAAAHVLDAIAAAGHEIGCHGQHHLHGWHVLPGAALRDIATGYASLARWVPPDGLFRPPCGKLTLPTAWHLRRRGAALAWWTLDSGDTHDDMPTPQQVEDRLAREGGGVVLLHDFDRQRPDADARHAFVLETAERLLRRARSMGLTVCRLGDVLRTGEAHGAGLSPAEALR